MWVGPTEGLTAAGPLLRQRRRLGGDVHMTPTLRGRGVESKEDVVREVA